MKKEKKISGSVFAKIVAFFILAISAVTSLVTAYVSAMLYDMDAYLYQNHNKCVQAVAREMMVNDAWDEMHYLREMYAPENIKLLEEEYANRNFAVEIYEGTQLLWGNYDGYETPYSFRYTYSEWVDAPMEEYVEPTEVPEQDVQVPEGNGVVKLDEMGERAVDTTGTGIPKVEENATYAENADSLEQEKTTDTNKIVVSENGEEIETAIPIEPATEMVLKEYTCRLYVNPDFSYEDEYMAAYNTAYYLCEGRYVYPFVAVGCVLLSIICFIFLMCSAGHRNGKEGITPSVLTSVPFDMLTVGFGGVAVFGLAVMLNLVDSAIDYGNLWEFVLVAVIGCIEIVWCTIYCMEFAIQLKLGVWWKHTVIATVCRFAVKIVRYLWRGLKTLVKGFPLVLHVAIIYMVICIAEFLGLCIWGDSGELFLVWIMEKVVLFAVVMYIALVCKKLQAGSKALAEGDLNFKMDTSMMVLDFKEHGENLNRIGEGISKAVEERMKSEHLKTELITNVSHDLKTPLTSIINYADLLVHEYHTLQPDNEKVGEYAEVLLRQSKRLKKLLEDLVEASKATTGALEVNLEQCEIGVLLSQAVGEYEVRFAEKQLNLIVRQPEEPVKILADGRHLWRVFDNLLNNICKYAQENSRVYLSVENKESQVEIIFRNMSKYALDISGEELEERFVRGDKSRHMEGNGLGLSIAKSLVELQNGQMQIVTDGDLFKVTLHFKAI